MCLKKKKGLHLGGRKTITKTEDHAVKQGTHYGTSYGKKVAFRQEMSGQVRIITEDLRVIERIFGQLRDLLKT